MQTQFYSGGSWRQPVDLQVYSGGSWRRVLRLYVYSGGSWLEVSPPFLWNVAAVTDFFPSDSGHVNVDYSPNVVKSISWRYQVNFGGYGAATVTNTDGTTPDAIAHVTATAGDTVSWELTPYTAVGGGGTAGPIYETSVVV